MDQECKRASGRSHREIGLSEKQTFLVRISYELPQGAGCRQCQSHTSYGSSCYKTMEMVNGPDMHLNQVIEGTRLPDQKAEEPEYLAGMYEITKTLTGCYQVSITFDDYTISKNADTAVTGWLL